jgi:hypothetical protein
VCGRAGPLTDLSLAWSSVIGGIGAAGLDHPDS